MKKIDLLHTTILIVAILCGYSALQTLLSILNLAAYLSDIYYARSASPAVPLLFQGGILTIACIVLIRNSKRIATYLARNDPQEYEEFPEGGDTSAMDTPIVLDKNPDDPEWQLDRQSILFVFFIGLGLYTLIQYIPSLLNAVIDQFKEKVSGAMRLIQPDRRDNRDFLLLYLLRITIGALLIYAAPNLTNYIEKTIATRLRGGPKTS
jgi:hypothetical protein